MVERTNVTLSTVRPMLTAVRKGRLTLTAVRKGRPKVTAVRKKIIDRCECQSTFSYRCEHRSHGR